MTLMGLVLSASWVEAGECTHLLPGKNVPDIQYYGQHGYKIGQIEVRSPFDFFFLIKQRLNAIKDTLPIQENESLSTAVKEEGLIAHDSDYDRSHKMVDAAVKEDSAFGEESPVKIVVTTDFLENCDEREDHKTVDVVYHVFSTDPVPALRKRPEQRRTTADGSATAVAEQNTNGAFKLQPLGGYDHSFRGFGGGEATLRLPGKMFNDFRFLGSGSSTSLLFDGELNGKAAPHLPALDTTDYHFGYHYAQSPSNNLNMAVGSAHARFTGTTKQLGSTSTQVLLRYGASIEQGLQQSNIPSATVAADTITNSAYGALRMYTGITSTTRYSETTVSYGLEVGGAGLSSLSFVKQVGDLSYSLRFPGCTHSPWDLQARVTGGGISGGPIVLNDRFFGGNVVTSFIPGDSWRIPNGPLVRSISANLLKGLGLGGTSFYSTNLTMGKVIKSWPLIDPKIQNSKGFGSGIEAAEDTAQGFFMDTYLAPSKEFQDLVVEYRSKLKSDLDAFRAEFQKIKQAVPSNAKINKALKLADDEARLGLIALTHLDGTKLRALYGPKSRESNLLARLPALTLLVPDNFKLELQGSEAELKKHLSDLKEAIHGIEISPVGKAAELRAQNDMARPREVIDTLRHEANMFALGLFGIFDTGRIWPDTHGTSFAYGGGVRLSVVNVNFNLGYAVNPNPQQSLGQGRGAVLFLISYTNLFR